MIHPTALVDSNAKIGANVRIGAYSIIYGNVQIGDDTEIGAYCEIGLPTPLSDGVPLSIGQASIIRSHSVFYQGSTFGEKLSTGHRVTVREKTIAGKGFQIGTLGDIQGHCSIGDYVKLHSNVHIGQHSVIGDYVWIFPYVVLTNDPHPPSSVSLGCTVQDYAAIATMSVILPGVVVKSGALVGAHSSVSKNVESDTVVVGNPARFICNTNAIKLRDGSGRNAYPWRHHFHRGYPEAKVLEWLAEISLDDPTKRGN